MFFFSFFLFCIIVEILSIVDLLCFVKEENFFSFFIIQVSSFPLKRRSHARIDSPEFENPRFFPDRKLARRHGNRTKLTNAAPPSSIPPPSPTDFQRGWILLPSPPPSLFFCSNLIPAASRGGKFSSFWRGQERWREHPPRL